MLRNHLMWIPVLVTAAVLAANPATAQVSDAAFACQRATSKSLAKMVKGQVACVAKCHQRARKGEIPFMGCTGQVAPGTDLELFACLIGTPTKNGIVLKSRDAIVKACTGTGRECPSCYPSGCSAGGHATFAPLQQLADSGPVLEVIHCTPASASADAKCMDATAKAYAKYAAGVAKCHDGCRARERKGAAAGSCSPPASDPATATCVATVGLKTALAIDKKCFVPPGAPPSCPGWPTSGAGWLPAFGASVLPALGDDSGDTYCVPPVCCVQSDSCSARASATECTNEGGTPFEGDFVCDASGGCVPPPGMPGECCEFGGACGMGSSAEGCIAFLGTTRVPAAVCMPGDVNACVATPRKLVFVTASTTNGAIGGLAGGDAFCQSEASATGLQGTFKAWLSDGTTSAAARLTHATVPYMRIDGVVVADDWADLTDGTLDAPIDRDSLGSVVSAAGVYTGTTAVGGADGFNCGSWTDASAAQFGRLGSTASTTSTWTVGGIGQCDAQRRLYCFEQ